MHSIRKGLINPADDTDPEVLWRREGRYHGTYQDVLAELYAAERETAWYQAQLACEHLARIQAESALERFKASLRELMMPVVKKRRPVVKERRRPGPRRVAA
jgi:hypothetical protein